MAARFWVGGGSSTSWNATVPTNWAATSGGTIRVAAPTSSDDVTFDGAGANGNGTSVVTTTTCLSFTVTSGYSGLLFMGAVLTVAGDITLGANMSISGGSSITSSAAGTLTSNGKAWPNLLTLSTAGATRTFADAWNISNLTVSLAMTITVNGLLTVSSTLTVATTINVTFAGTSGFTVGTFLMSTTNTATITLTNTNIYTVTAALTGSATRPSLPLTLTSDHATNQVNLILQQGATCAMTGVLTRINATGGRNINVWNGVLTSCTNVFSYTDNLPSSKAGISLAGATY